MFTSVLLAAVLIFIAALCKRRRSKLPLPPGPRKLPIVGNLFDVPSTFQWETFAKWSKEYKSDIIHLNLAGKSLIVLCSLEATDTLLEKRSSIYSDRDDFPMVNDLMGWDFLTPFMKYGDEWRIHRRLFNQFGPGVQNYEPNELLATHVLLKRILSTPDEFLNHFRQIAGEVIMSLTYGIDVLPCNDPYVTLAQQAVHTWTAALVPGLYLVDSFPVLKHIPTWFPGAGFKREAREWRKLARGMAELPFSETKRQMDSGMAPPSFTADCLDALKDPDQSVFFEEHHVWAAAGSMFVGGADTTVSALGTFILAMLANPEAQKRAQAEIDSVTGGQVLPTFEDRDSLPYVDAIVKEILRWKPVGPIAVPHRLMVEDEYRGYRLPAGSIVIGNTWALLHDETVYPDPHVFKPERFLLKDLNSEVKDPEVAFGYKRRQCPGRHMATASVWITVASILATFDISKAKDANRQLIEPSYEYSSTVISGLLPFKCSMIPRSKQAIELIQAANLHHLRA